MTKIYEFHIFSYGKQYLHDTFRIKQKQRKGYIKRKEKKPSKVFVKRKEKNLSKVFEIWLLRNQNFVCVAKLWKEWLLLPTLNAFELVSDAYYLLVWRSHHALSFCYNEKMRNVKGNLCVLPLLFTTWALPCMNTVQQNLVVPLLIPGHYFLQKPVSSLHFAWTVLK